MNYGEIHETLDRFFRIKEKGSDIGTEVRAGLVTFLTMSYILLANPLLLSHCGIPAHDIVVGTAASASVATFIAGVFGNLPFGCAPGLGLSAYMAYGLVNQAGLTWQAGLTICFITGAITFLLAITRISELVMNLIPDCIKISTVVGMGLLVSFIGLTEIHVVVSDPESLVTLGDMSDWTIWLSFVGLVIISALRTHQSKGNLLIGIAVVTFIYWGVTKSYPRSVMSLPAQKAAFFSFAFTKIDPKWIPGIVAFLFIGIFDVSGVMFGLAKTAGILPCSAKPVFSEKDEEPMVNGHSHSGGESETKTIDAGSVPGGIWIFIGTSVGTMVAAILGCSPIIVHVESLAGIDEGGKTGLTSLVISALFALALFFAPVLGSIPPCATSPVLIILGTLMMQEARNINFAVMQDAVPSFFTIVIMPFTFSIPNGIAFGLVSYAAIYIVSESYGVFLRQCCSRSIKKEKSIISPTESEGTPLLPQSSPIGIHVSPPARYGTELDGEATTPRYGVVLPGSPNARANLADRNKRHITKPSSQPSKFQSSHIDYDASLP